MSHRRSIGRTALVVAALVMLAACATAPAPDAFTGAQAPIQLTVNNYDFRDATIFAAWQGVRERIGTVTGKTTQTFSMDWRDHELRLEVDFIGGGGFQSPDVLSVWGGEQIEFVIMPGW